METKGPLKVSHAAGWPAAVGQVKVTEVSR